MNLLRDAPMWAQLLLVGILLAAATQDIVQRRISNWMCVAVMIAAVAAAIAGGPTISLWQNALCFSLLLALGIPLFASGWLGGGDVKLVAALGLWTNFAAFLPLLACILLAGGALAIISVLVHGGAARSAKGVPYGVAIAVGAVIVMLRPTLFGASAQPVNPLDLKAARASISLR